MKKLLILLVAAFIVMSMTSFAGDTGEKAFGDVYYKVLPTGQNPVYPPNGTNWNLVPGTGIVNFSVAVGQDLYIAVENSLVSTNATDLTLKLFGTALIQMPFESVWADPVTTVVAPRGAPYESDTYKSYPYRFVPQPDWHYFKFYGFSTGPANITKIQAVPNCYVPSLTTYGIAALVLILIASSIFVIYRRRRTVTA